MNDWFTKGAVAVLGLAAACAPAEPEWASGHPADPGAPTGEEVPVARVLREDPPDPPQVESDAHHQHGSNAEEQPAEEEHDAH